MEKNYISDVRFQDETKRDVIKTNWLKVPTGDGHVKSVANGQTVTPYRYAVSEDNSRIRINGKVYSVKDNFEFTIKIQRTQIQARDGAAGLMKFLTTFQSAVADGWEQKIIQNCRALN